MALSKGTNSFATVSEADKYFEDRLDSAAWTAATAAQRAQALVTATSMLCELEWSGAASDSSQPLAFPRTGQFYDPMYGTVVELSGSTPARVVRATYELAYHLLNNDGLLDETGGARDISVGTINLSLLQKPARIPQAIRKMVGPLLVNGGARIWWRAN